jgi:hypothetical protein
MDGGLYTTEITVGETGLRAHDEMLFTFDYGDSWQFRVVLERIDPEGTPVRQCELIEQAGKAPEQYPSYEQ